MIKGIRNKLLLIMGGIVSLVLVVLIQFQLSSQLTIIREELDNRKQLMTSSLEKQALILSRALQSQAEADIASKEMFKLMQKLTLNIDNNQALSYAVLYDENEHVYLNTLNPALERQSLQHSPQLLIEYHLDSPTGIGISHVRDSEGKNFIEYKIPIFDQRDDFYYLHQLRDDTEAPPAKENKAWGYIVLGFTTRFLQEEIAKSEAYYEALTDKVTSKTLVVACVILLLTYLVISRISKKMTNPLVALTHHSEEIANGNLSGSNLPEIVVPKGDATDEIGVLSKSFDSMAIKLRDSYQKLAEYNETLENKVEERTEELRHNNTMLQHTLNELEESHQQLIHAEKMAALGQLIAGIAHEINTPLGAIQASVGNSGKSMQYIANNLQDFAANTSRKDMALMQTFFNDSMLKKNLSSREERAARRKIARYLDDVGIKESDQMAEMLVELGVTREDHEVIKRLEQAVNSYAVNSRAANDGISADSEHLQRELYRYIEFSYQFSSIARSNMTIQNAVARASKIVFALKHYSHSSSTGNMIKSNINDGLATVLVLYQNMLKQGCDVDEHFGSLPEIECYPDELNQVWTNLIHNAIQAMENKGQLIIRTQCVDDAVTVKIQDSGSGIPDEILSKIFEPFYTTKPAGEGSGMGLDICKRIIEKHQGTIAVESEPGRTVFTVTLPIAQIDAAL